MEERRGRKACLRSAHRKTKNSVGACEKRLKEERKKRGDES